MRLNGFDRFPLAPPLLILDFSAGANAHMHEHEHAHTGTVDHYTHIIANEGTSCHHSKCK